MNTQTSINMDIDMNMNEPHPLYGDVGGPELAHGHGHEHDHEY